MIRICIRISVYVYLYTYLYTYVYSLSHANTVHVMRRLKLQALDVLLRNSPWDRLYTKKSQPTLLSHHTQVDVYSLGKAGQTNFAGHPAEKTNAFRQTNPFRG